MTTQIKTEEFDHIFDGGEDIMDYIDTSVARVVKPEPTSVKRVNVDFPEWMVNALDREADRLAISRQAVVKVWVAEKIEGLSKMRT